MTNQLSYTYDAVGNRKTESGTDQNGVAVNKSADYDDLDRLTELTETNLTSRFDYDNNSNLTKVSLKDSGDTTFTDNETFEYDIRNQLSKYTSIGNGITADYDYDFERKRLSKTVSGDRRDYVYAGNQVINEYVKDTIADTNPVLNASYGIGSGEVVKSDFVGEGSRNYFSDALGSITSLADASSSLISRNDYDSFGEIVASSGISQNAVTYTGQRLDVESGLMALGNGERYYNPSYGRFIQQDSYAGMPDMPQSLNRFAYTYNNPFSFTDPSGNNPQEVGKSLTGNQTLDWYVRFGVSLATQIPTKEKFNQSLELWNSWALGVGDAFDATGKGVAALLYDPVSTAGNAWGGLKQWASDLGEIAMNPIDTFNMVSEIVMDDPNMAMRELGKASGEVVIAEATGKAAAPITRPLAAGLKRGAVKAGTTIANKAKNSTIGKATTQVASHTVSKISSKATTLKTGVSNGLAKVNQKIDTYFENRANRTNNKNSKAVEINQQMQKHADDFATLERMGAEDSFAVRQGLQRKGEIVGMADESGSSRYGTGTTEGGLSRTTSTWRQRFGPSSMREHHLVPQALLNDVRFTNRLSQLGIDDAQRFIDKKVSIIPHAKHADVHNSGWNRDWNRDWKRWLRENPNFTTKDIEIQVKTLMKEYNIPKNSRNNRVYGRN